MWLFEPNNLQLKTSERLPGQPLRGIWGIGGLEYGADGEGEGAVVVEGHAVVAFGQGAP